MTFGKASPPAFGPGKRGLDVTRLRNALRDCATWAPLSAIVVYQDRSASVATILDGVHRYFAAVAVGYPLIPCEPVTLTDVEQVYQYPDGHR